MREFMEYMLQSWGDVTGWNRSNSYAQLNQTANGMFSTRA